MNVVFQNFREELELQRNRERKKDFRNLLEEIRNAEFSLHILINKKCRKPFSFCGIVFLIFHEENIIG